MRIYGYSYWIFITCFFIQIFFSRAWMMHKSETFLFAIIPVVASLIVLYRSETIKHITGKIVISLMIFFGFLATLDSVHVSPNNI